MDAEATRGESARHRAGETRVNLEFLDGARRHQLLFGVPEAVLQREHDFGITRRTALFRSGQRFALELWDGKIVLSRSREPVPRTERWRILVLEAGRSGDLVSHVPGVEPGAHVLLEASGVKTCQLLKQWIEELAEQGDPAALPREFFLARDLRLRAHRRRDPALALRAVGDGARR